MREEGEGPGPRVFGRARGWGRFFENMSEDERREMREKIERHATGREAGIFPPAT